MAPPPGCPGGGRTKEGLGGVGRGGVGVGAGFWTALTFMGRNSFAFGFSVEFFTCTAAADADSGRSLLSEQPSSLLGADWVVPGCSSSGPEAWGPTGAVGVEAAGVVVGAAASAVCCRSWAEEVRGFSGTGEEEDESAGEEELC